MKILLTNDDGIASNNLRSLIKALSAEHTVYVFAPHTQKSACSQSLTVHSSFGYTVVKDVEGAELAVAVEGTPTDCVKVAFHKFGIRPNLVLSGPNEGSNLGTDILYSGTVAGAMEGVILGCKAMALSQCGRKTEPTYCIEFFRKNIEKFYSMCGVGYLLNINVPNLPKEEIKGVAFTKMGVSEYNDYYVENSEEGRKVYRLAGELQYHEDGAEDCDIKLLQRGFITVTPVKMDRTDYVCLDKLKSFKM